MKINFYTILCLVIFPFLTNAQQFKINEVMASNTATLASDLGNFGDWVELYNPTNTDIDLSGLYFTDDITTPTKYQFPIGGINAIIPANGFKLIWADDSAEALHANFKLSGTTGETIAIYAADGLTLIDSISFGAQTTDVSYGRSSDGGTIWTNFNTSTPEASNGPTTLQKTLQLNSYFQIFPNPTESKFTIQNMNWESLIIFDLNGKVSVNFINNFLNKNTFEIGHLPAGSYQIQLISEGKIYTSKLLKF
jgi:hypothetical protein